jgi:hypothetical protein
VLAAVLMPVSSLTVVLSSALTRTFAVTRMSGVRSGAAANRAEARSAKAGA